MITGAVPRQILQDELEELRLAIIEHHLSAGQKASGKTAASMHVEVTETRGTLFGRSAFGTLETGRKAGKVPAGFTGIIKQWMKDKGIEAEPIPYKTDRPHKYTPKERGENTLAFLIARKIKKSGTQLFRQGGRSDIYSNEVPVTTRKIGERLLEMLSTEVKSIKLNNKEVIK